MALIFTDVLRHQGTLQIFKIILAVDESLKVQNFVWRGQKRYFQSAQILICFLRQLRESLDFLLKVLILLSNFSQPCLLLRANELVLPNLNLVFKIDFLILVRLDLLLNLPNFQVNLIGDFNNALLCCLRETQRHQIYVLILWVIGPNPHERLALVEVLSINFEVNFEFIYDLSLQSLDFGFKLRDDPIILGNFAVKRLDLLQNRSEVAFMQVNESLLHLDFLSLFSLLFLLFLLDTGALLRNLFFIFFNLLYLLFQAAQVDALRVTRTFFDVLQISFDLSLFVGQLLLWVSEVLLNLLQEHPLLLKLLRLLVHLRFLIF